MSCANTITRAYPACGLFALGQHFGDGEAADRAAFRSYAGAWGDRINVETLVASTAEVARSAPALFEAVALWREAEAAVDGEQPDPTLALLRAASGVRFRPAAGLGELCLAEAAGLLAMLAVREHGTAALDGEGRELLEELAARFPTTVFGLLECSEHLLWEPEAESGCVASQPVAAGDPPDFAAVSALFYEGVERPSQAIYASCLYVLAFQFGQLRREVVTDFYRGVRGYAGEADVDELLEGCERLARERPGVYAALRELPTDAGREALLGHVREIFADAPGGEVLHSDDPRVVLAQMFLALSMVSLWHSGTSRLSGRERLRWDAVRGNYPYVYLAAREVCRRVLVGRGFSGLPTSASRTGTPREEVLVCELTPR